VKTPCCSTSYCEECIYNYLSENDFVCPECESKIKSLKILIKDEDRRTRAKQYLEDTLKASKAVGDAEKKAKEGSNEADDTQSHTGSDNGNANGQNEEGGIAEEGEVYGEEQVSSIRQKLVK
jgi:protein MPE1